MGLEGLGNLGYQIGAVGIILVTVVFFLVVRWWTDHLGRVLAVLLGSISLVLVTTILRMMDVPLPNFMVWRAAMFCMFGIAVWAGLLTLIWAQFFAPRVRNKPTPRRGHEEADLADSGHHRDGDPHDRTGRSDG